MSNQDRIGLLFDTAGELVAVRYSIFEAGSDGPGCIDAIEFSFVGGGIATVYAEPEFDTVRLELAEMVVREDCVRRDATTSTLWADLMGAACRGSGSSRISKVMKMVFALSFLRDAL